MSVNDFEPFNENDVIDIDELGDIDDNAIYEESESASEAGDFSELSGSDDEDEDDDEDDDEDGMEQIMEYLNSKGTKVSVTSGVTPLDIDKPNGQFEDEGSQLFVKNLIPGSSKKKLQVASEFAELAEAVNLTDIEPIQLHANLTGNIDKDLVLNYGESMHEFNTRSQITRALVAAPYNLDVSTALVAGKIWAKKALFKTVYSDRIEKALVRIQQKAL